MSQTDQAGEQSLEQILSSIREKIATNDDISTADTNTPNSPAQSKFTLSTKAATTAPSGNEDFDDDLSDMLENPLPNSTIQPANAHPSNNKPNTAVKVAKKATDTPAPSKLELGNVVPGHGSKGADGAPIQFGALAATISGAAAPTAPGHKANGTGSLQANSKQKSEPTLKSPASSPSQGASTHIATKEPNIEVEEMNATAKVGVFGDAVPRAMPTMASALNMARMQVAMPGPAKLATSSTNGIAKPEQANTTTAAPKPGAATAPIANEMPNPASMNGSVAAASPAEVAVATQESQKSTVASGAEQGQTLASNLSINGSKTVEDLVAEMLRPMLNDWLEANMPRIVENALRIEVLESSKDDSSAKS